VARPERGAGDQRADHGARLPGEAAERDVAAAGLVAREAVDDPRQAGREEGLSGAEHGQARDQPGSRERLARRLACRKDDDPRGAEDR
jgi:hypothetical protein